MKRRRFLSTVAIAATGTLPRLTSASNAAFQPNTIYRRIRPTDSNWPTPASWAQLNNTVGNTLIQVQPLFGTCPTDPDGSTCTDAMQHIDNPYWLGDQPAGTQNSGLLDAWTPAPSAYAIKARHAADVAAGINFARAHHLRLVVKGGGHSYLGTSNALDSLLIWTRAMNAVTLHDAFVPRGCEGSTEPVPAVSAGAGAMWMDLYQAVTTEGGRYVQGGSCTTVGVAGLVQSGGFNAFSKGFGTAAAGLLEAEVVTADGHVRVVNQCYDPGLFWALKGGGGGTFGVVTRVTLRTHALPRFFGAAWGKVQARSSEAFARLVTRFVDFYEAALCNPHWGEHVHIGSDNTLALDMISQGLDAAQVRAAWQPFFAWVEVSPDDFSLAEPFGTGAWDARAWWDLDKSTSMRRDTRPGAPRHHGWSKGDQGEVGIFLHGYDSLWLPASLLAVDRRGALAEALVAASRHQMVRLHVGKGLAGAGRGARGRAANGHPSGHGRCFYARHHCRGGAAARLSGLGAARHRSGGGAAGSAQHRPGRGRIAQARARLGLLRFREQLLQP